MRLYLELTLNFLRKEHLLKGLIRQLNEMSRIYIEFRVLKLRFSAFSRGYGGFRELREAGRKHFHLSWYLLVPGVTSYDQKPWGAFFWPLEGNRADSLKFLVENPIQKSGS